MPRLRSMLRELIEWRKAVTNAGQTERGVIVPWIFHRNGEPIRSFRRSWITACIAAGLGQEVRDTRGKLVKR